MKIDRTWTKTNTMYSCVCKLIFRIDELFHRNNQEKHVWCFENTLKHKTITLLIHISSLKSVNDWVRDNNLGAELIASVQYAKRKMCKFNFNFRWTIVWNTIWLLKKVWSECATFIRKLWSFSLAIFPLHLLVVYLTVNDVVKHCSGKWIVFDRWKKFPSVVILHREISAPKRDQ